MSEEGEEGMQAVSSRLHQNRAVVWEHSQTSGGALRWQEQAIQVHPRVVWLSQRGSGEESEALPGRTGCAKCSNAAVAAMEARSWAGLLGGCVPTSRALYRVETMAGGHPVVVNGVFEAAASPSASAEGVMLEVVPGGSSPATSHVFPEYSRLR